MTLIVAQPAADGIVLGSDSQVTTGPIRTKAIKVHKLNDHALWAGSGELALVQRVAERIAASNEDGPLPVIRDTLAGFVKDSMETLLNLDFRTRFAMNDPEAMLNLHPGDFLFVEHREGICRTLHVTINGIAEWIEGRACTGNGAPFAHALLGKYEDVTLTRVQARLLVFKVIEEAIRVGSYGVGPPIDIWDVSTEGVHQCTNEEIAALADGAAVLRSAEIDLLENHELPAIEHGAETPTGTAT